MDRSPTASFSGSVTTTGRSEAIRLDKALFKAHPEFRQRARVRAHVLGPGHLLISLADGPSSAAPDEIERDMLAHPERIAPPAQQDLAHLRRLTDGVEVNDADSIPDDVTL